MVDRCRFNILEEIPPVPPVPTTLFIAPAGTQLLHKTFFDGSSFEIVDTFNNGVINNVNAGILYDGNKVYYRPERTGNTDYIIEPSTMTADDIDNLGAYGPNFIVDGFLDLKFVTFGSIDAINGYDSNQDPINPWIDGFAFFVNNVGFTGGIRGGQKGAIRGNNAHWPTNRAIFHWQSYDDFEHYMAKCNPTSIIRSLDNFRCIEMVSVDTAHPDEQNPLYVKYFDYTNSFQLTSDEDRWIHMESGSGIVTFHEFGNPDFRSSIDWGFGALIESNTMSSMAVTTNDTFIFPKNGKLWMCPDIVNATAGDLVELTNTDSIPMNSGTLMSSIAI